MIDWDRIMDLLDAAADRMFEVDMAEYRRIDALLSFTIRKYWR